MKRQNSALHLYIRQQKVLRSRKQRVGIYIIIIILLYNYNIHFIDLLYAATIFMHV